MSILERSIIGEVGTVESLIDGFSYASIAGIVRSAFGGVKDGVRRGITIYAGYVVGQSIIEYL